MTPSPTEGRQVLDCVIQEVDIATGKVVWDWHSLDHVGIGESHVDVPKDPKTPMDYFHINSIDEEPNGNLLVSARNTWALYELDKKSGEVLWRLGGRRSDFALGDGVRFAWQHDARRQPDGTITLFDNEATPKVRDFSRAMVLKVDEPARTVSVVHAFTHPAGVLSFAEGNTQLLPDGGVFVGWGLGRRASELGPTGKLLFDVRLPGDTDSYRATTVDWHGTPSDPPALYPTRASNQVTAYASWNGATDVTAWQLVGGTSASDLHPVGAGREPHRLRDRARGPERRAADRRARPLGHARPGHFGACRPIWVISIQPRRGTLGACPPLPHLPPRTIAHGSGSASASYSGSSPSAC